DDEDEEKNEPRGKPHRRHDDREEDDEWPEKRRRHHLHGDDDDDGEYQRTKLRDWRHDHQQHPHLGERHQYGPWSRRHQPHDWDVDSDDEYERVRVGRFVWRRHRHFAVKRDGEREYDEEESERRVSRHDDDERQGFPFESMEQLSVTQDTVKEAAKKKSQDKDDADRVFFTAFAQTYCEKRVPAYAELLRTIDPHSPGRWRVNGPLMNFDKFAAAFRCKQGTPMNPVKQCPVW
ncbi:Neprilysin cd10, peptidase, partial [Globisporangium polare]